MLGSVQRGGGMCLLLSPSGYYPSGSEVQSLTPVHGMGVWWETELPPSALTHCPSHLQHPALQAN